MYDPKALEELYYKIEYVEPQEVTHFSDGLCYLGYFGGFGPIWAQHKLWSWNKTKTPDAYRGKHLVRSQAFQEQALDMALKRLKDCVVLCSTASYYSQYQSACLLASRGFKLLGGTCYKHPGYPELSTSAQEHPGIPDRYHHWEHIWWKVIGKPRRLGEPLSEIGTEADDYNGDYEEVFTLNNCGIDALVGLDEIRNHENCSRSNFLAVGILPRGVLFPKGWKRFFSGEDFKLGVNLGSSKLKHVQKCPHVFDLKIFEGWQPDFEKFTPA